MNGCSLIYIEYIFFYLFSILKIFFCVFVIYKYFLVKMSYLGCLLIKVFVYFGSKRKVMVFKILFYFCYSCVIFFGCKVFKKFEVIEINNRRYYEIVVRMKEKFFKRMYIF